MIGYFRDGILCHLLAYETRPKRCQRSKIGKLLLWQSAGKNEYKSMSAEDAQMAIYLNPEREKMASEFVAVK